MSEQFLQLHNKYDSSRRLSVNGSTVNNNLCLLCYKVVHSAEGAYVRFVFFLHFSYIFSLICVLVFFFAFSVFFPADSYQIEFFYYFLCMKHFYSNNLKYLLVTIIIVIIMIIIFISSLLLLLLLVNYHHYWNYYFH